VAACGTGRSPVNGSRPKPRASSTYCGASVIHSLIAMSERAPVSTAAAAAHSNATAGCPRPRLSRGSATRIRNRRRSTTSFGARAAVREPSCSTRRTGPLSTTQCPWAGVQCPCAGARTLKRESGPPSEDDGPLTRPRLLRCRALRRRRCVAYLPRSIHSVQAKASSVLGCRNREDSCPKSSRCSSLIRASTCFRN
jgi:hypothetical protein